MWQRSKHPHTSDHSSLCLFTPSFFLCFGYNNLYRSYFFLKFLLFSFLSAEICYVALAGRKSSLASVSKVLGLKPSSWSSTMILISYSQTLKSFLKNPPPPERHTGYLSTMTIPRTQHTGLLHRLPCCSWSTVDRCSAKGFWLCWSVLKFFNYQFILLHYPSGVYSNIATFPFSLPPSFSPSIFLFLDTFSFSASSPSFFFLPICLS